MSKRVTLQDVADALHLSRNTVSKAINNSPAVAEATKQQIYKKAAEMGYKQFSYFGVPDTVPAKGPDGPKEIALLTEFMFGNSHFGTFMIDKMQSELARLGYGFTIYRVIPEDIRANRLPASFDPGRMAGIVCMELFYYEYMEMVCSLNTPVLLVDAPISFEKLPIKADILLMENKRGIYILIGELQKKGVRRIGFVGEILHCRSFYERFTAFHDALRIFNLPYEPEICLTDIDDKWNHTDHDGYIQFMESWINGLETLPDCFICANDFVAIDLMTALRNLGYSVPEDVMISGFDDSQESRLITPKLSTVHIHSQSMAVSAIDLLLSRMKEPDIAYRTVYLETDLILRESTRD